MRRRLDLLAGKNPVLYPVLRAANAVENFLGCSSCTPASIVIITHIHASQNGDARLLNTLRLKKTTSKPAKDGYYRVLGIPFQGKHKKLFDEMRIIEATFENRSLP